MVRGEEIERLIPQRYPMVMVDEFEPTDQNNASTALNIRTDNIFATPQGQMTETGLIEHIAQSASALAGWNSLQQEAIEAPVGIIGEVKHFKCGRRPEAGETIRTDIRFRMAFGNVVLAYGRTSVGNEVIAEAELKIFIQQ